MGVVRRGRRQQTGAEPGTIGELHCPGERRFERPVRRKFGIGSTEIIAYYGYPVAHKRARGIPLLVVDGVRLHGLIARKVLSIARGVIPPTGTGVVLICDVEIHQADTVRIACKVVSHQARLHD